MKAYAMTGRLYIFSHYAGEFFTRGNRLAHNILEFMTSLFIHKNFTNIKPKCKQTKNLLKIHVSYLKPWYTCWLPHPPLHSPFLYTLRLPPSLRYILHVQAEVAGTRGREDERDVSMRERRGLE